MATETENSEVVEPEAPASRLSDDPKIVDAVQAHLDAFLSDGEVVETPDPKVETKETPVEGEHVVEPVVEPVVESVVEPVVEAVIAGDKPEDSTLPAAYVRTAKARGWTDQEIIDFNKATPELALKTMERMHESRTKELNEWAELGRRSRLAPAAGQVVASPVASPAAPVATGAEVSLQPINVQELAEKFGNEELIAAIAGPINAQVAAMQPLMAEVKATRERENSAHQATLAKTVQDFFSSDEMKSFVPVYGPAAFEAKTPEQRDKVSRVLEMADALIAGAAHQGRDVQVPDALMLAHDSIASEFKENIIRDGIREKVAKREKSITLKPTAKGRVAVGGPPRDRQELLSRTEDRLAAAFS